MKRLLIVKKDIFKNNFYTDTTYDVYVNKKFLFLDDYVEDVKDLTEEQLDEYMKSYYTNVGTVKITVKFKKVNIV